MPTPSGSAMFAQQRSENQLGALVVAAPDARHELGPFFLRENIRHLKVLDCDSLGMRRDARGIQGGGDDLADALTQEGRNGVADLSCNLGLGSLKDEIIGEALQPCRLAVGDRSMLLRVQISPLLRLEKLGADRERGSIPP